MSRRILFIASGKIFGGIERVMLTLCSGVTNCEIEFGFCFETLASESVKSAGGEVHLFGPLRAANPVSWIRETKKLRTCLKSGNFDCVVFLSAWTLALLGAGAGDFKGKVVLWLQDSVRPKNWPDRIAKNMRIDLLIGVSRYIVDQARAHYDVREFRTCGNPVDGRAFIEARRHRNPYRSVYGFSESDVVFLQLGRIDKWKGIHIALESLASLDDLECIKYWIVGSPQTKAETSYYDELVAMVTQYGLSDCVKWTPLTKKSWECYAAADVFIQPNLDPEPFGIVFMEAMAAGLPIISPFEGGPGDFLSDKFALNMGLGSREDCSRNIEMIGRNSGLRTAMSAEASKNWRLHYSFETQLRKLTSLLL
jgi:glycosyltransferase involved in cell wall biosynthesis